MEGLIRGQQELYEQLQKADRNFKKANKEQKSKPSYMAARIEAVNKLEEAFSQNHLEIVSSATKLQKQDLAYFTEDLQDSFQEMFIDYKTSLTDTLERLSSAASPTTITTTASSSEVQLPRIQLPNFSGKYNEWQSFHDMFVSLIHDNATLSPVQKLHYLKSSLSGEPETLLRNFPTTAVNYKEAWNLLMKRYNNKRYNCNAIMRILFGQKCIQSESAGAIRQLLDSTTSCLKAVKNLGMNINGWDVLIIHLVATKLDHESHRQWENHVSAISDDLPTWKQMEEFLEVRFRTLEMLDTSKQIGKYDKFSKSFHSTMGGEGTSSDQVCPMCGGSHTIYQCTKFKEQPVIQRQNFAQTKKLCFNCLSSTHSVSKCYSAACRRCGRKHHTLLHFEDDDRRMFNEIKQTEEQKPEMLSITDGTETAQEKKVIVNFARGDTQAYNVLLPTAVVKACSKNGTNYILRALLDQGSQASFITEDSVQLLGLKRTNVNGMVSGLGDGHSKIKHAVVVDIKSRHEPEKVIRVRAYVLSRLTSLLPSREVQSPDWLELENLPLADPGFAKPGKVDVLIGADAYGQMLLTGVKKSPSENLIAQNTIFGWILSGKVSEKSTNEEIVNLHVKIGEEFTLEKFSEMENEPNCIDNKHTLKERCCEEFYDSTTERREDGRFVARLPFKTEDSQCQYGQSRHIAERKLNFLERRMSKNSTLYQEYQNVFDEHITLKHMNGLMNAGGFQDQKWSSNNAKLKNYIEHDTRNNDKVVVFAKMYIQKLLNEVAQVMKVPKENLFAWTYSTVVSAGLKRSISCWVTFVSKRVSHILTVLDVEQLGHVSTMLNPADCASRGLTPSELQSHEMWWTGPKWLSDPFATMRQPEIPDTHEEEKIKSFATINEDIDSVWMKFSDLTKLLKVISYCRRVLNAKLPQNERKSYPEFVTKDEMNRHLLECVKQVQSREYKEDINFFQTRGYVMKRSALYTLYPFLDKNGISRVGGRISLTDVHYDQKHPFILPAKNHLSKLLVADAHQRTYFHGGPQVMMSFVRLRFWIIRARDLVKTYYRSCVICRRHSKEGSNQLMGQLPEVILKPGKEFKSTRVYYAVPINIQFLLGSDAISYKGYICLFVCILTRAIHLEAVTDLTAKGFVAAFKRFTSRKGHCQDLYSDNGTNFVGTDTMLREMFNSAKSELPNQIAQLLTLESTTWHFIPPSAPNFGELWEADVRCTKRHLKRVIGDCTLTYEEISTVLAQVEACLNSQPISILRDNPDDPLPLTPGHFLIDDPLLNISDIDYSERNVTGLDKWKLVQKMVHCFWRRWYKEYLSNLNQRNKWCIKKPDVDLKDVVVIRDDNVPPTKWIIGVITDKHTGPDNVTRVVTIKHMGGSFQRKICVLTKSE